MSQLPQLQQEKHWWHDLLKALFPLRPVVWLASRTLHHLDSFVIRRTGGKHSATAYFSGLPIVTLTTTGARSDKKRSVPLIAIPDGDNLIFIASNWGQGHHPAWYYNMRAHPKVEISRDAWSRDFIAHEATGAEREGYWHLAVAAYPGYAAYARRAANRTIPVMVCILADNAFVPGVG